MGRERVSQSGRYGGKKRTFKDGSSLVWQPKLGIRVLVCLLYECQISVSLGVGMERLTRVLVHRNQLRLRDGPGVHSG